MSELKVASCSHQAARFAVEHWHYSRAMPLGALIKFGVWEYGEFVGAVIYGRGAAKNLFRPFGLTAVDGVELVRVAMREHSAPVSQVVAETLRRLQQLSPGTRLVVSFADPSEGHHGAIYQAGNWIYTGQSPPTPVFYDSTGRKYHARQVSKIGYKPEFGKMRRVPRISDLRKVMMPGKHRYVMPLDRAMRRRVARLALPYPAPADQVSEGDAPLSGGEGQVRSLRSAPLDSTAAEV